MNYSRVNNLQQIIRNGVPITCNVNYNNETNCYQSSFQYPNNFDDTLTLLLKEKITPLNIEIIDQWGVQIVNKEIGYSSGLSDAFCDHFLILKNPYKIPMFEYMMHNLLEIIISSYKYMPNCYLKNFFKEEMSGQPQPFGKIGYFIDLTDKDVVHFFTNVNSHVKHITMKEVRKLFEEIKVYTGTNKHYGKFAAFLKRLKYISSIEEIAQDEFFIHCSKRRNIPVLDGNEFSHDQVILDQGTFGTIEKRKWKEKKCCLKTLNAGAGGRYYILEHNRELQLGVAMYDQPNIIRIYGGIPSNKTQTIPRQFENFGTQPTIVMKAEKTSLKNYFMKTTAVTKKCMYEINPKQTLIMICDILTGALAFKQSDMLFRDYKSNNILVTEEDRCILCDLGSCICTSDNNPGRTMICTPAYAPKDFATAVDKTQNDVYALGMTILQFFTTEFVEASQEKTRSQKSEYLANYMLQNFVNTLKKLSVTLKDEFIDLIQHILPGCLNQQELLRNRFDSLEFLRVSITMYLKQKFNFDYEPIEGYPVKPLNIIEVLKEGFEWYEKVVSENIPVQFYYDYEDLKEDKQMKISERIELYVYLFESLLLIYSEQENIKMMEECLERLMTILSFSFVSKGFIINTYIHHIVSFGFERLFELKNKK